MENENKKPEKKKYKKNLIKFVAKLIEKNEII